MDRVETDAKTLSDRLRDGVNRFGRRGPPADADWNSFMAAVTYQQADFDDPAAYVQLRDYLAQIDAQWNAKANHVFYLATPPALFGMIARRLGEAGLSQDAERSHIVVEKPLGYDLESARQLNRTLTEQLPRGRRSSASITIWARRPCRTSWRSASPTCCSSPFGTAATWTTSPSRLPRRWGSEHRGGYYDHAGALRDMVQNHLLQLLCLVAMEPPVSFEAEEIRNKKVDVLHADPPDPPSRRSCVRRPRPIWRRLGQGGARVRIPQRRGRGAGIGDGNVRGDQAVRGQLALARRAVLLADGQAAAAVRFRGIRFAFAPCRTRRFPDEAALDWQPARLIIQHPARRRNRAAVSGQAAGAANVSPAGRYAVQLSGDVPEGVARRL